MAMLFHRLRAAGLAAVAVPALAGLRTGHTTAKDRNNSRDMHNNRQPRIFFRRTMVLFLLLPSNKKNALENL